MMFEDLERHAAEAGLSVGKLATSDGQTYLHFTGITIGGGTHAGEVCEVAILRTTGTPWVPQAAVHVRPHLVAMGQCSSQGSTLGGDWQYLSRRFDHPPTPRSFLAHILTVLAEL